MDEAVTRVEAADIAKVMAMLPHRYPFLMVDRVIDMRGDEHGIGIKNVTINEPHFQGHFPEFAVMPGVLIVEALAQTAGALVVYSLGHDSPSRKVYFMTIDKARFRRPVRPGDMLRFPVKAIRHRGPVWRFSGEAFVGDELCAEAEFSAMIFDGNDDNSSDGNR